MQLSEIRENALLSGWWDILRRHPRQANGVHESDAELMPIGGGMLAATIDTIAEEIGADLYPDAETIGWMAATASLSDLAAVGAEPVGLLVSATLEDRSMQVGIARGLDEACAAAGTHVLGGDTNFGAHTSVTTVAMGMAERPMRRTGCRVGDYVYSTGPFGAGACCAARALMGVQVGEWPFRPRARIAEGRRIAGTATSCMDTSDGLIATLDQLARLNGAGFDIESAPLGEGVRELCAGLGVDETFALALCHGEYELVFTTREEIEGFVRLGRVVDGEGIRIRGHAIDGARARNAWEEARGNWREYVRLLRESCGAWGCGAAGPPYWKWKDQSVVRTFSVE
jgi:thiamine-monophosphate kinase